MTIEERRELFDRADRGIVSLKEFLLANEEAFLTIKFRPTELYNFLSTDEMYRKYPLCCRQADTGAVNYAAKYVNGLYKELEERCKALGIKKGTVLTGFNARYPYDIKLTNGTKCLISLKPVVYEDGVTTTQKESFAYRIRWNNTVSYALENLGPGKRPPVFLPNGKIDRLKTTAAFFHEGAKPLLISPETASEIEESLAFLADKLLPKYKAAVSDRLKAYEVIEELLSRPHMKLFNEMLQKEEEKLAADLAVKKEMIEKKNEFLKSIPDPVRAVFEKKRMTLEEMETVVRGLRSERDMEEEKEL